MENNYKGYAVRYESRFEELHVGDILAVGKHWSSEEADPECYTRGGTVYRFECDNAEGHKINYDMLDEDSDEYDAEYAEECEALGINADCDDEKEVVVDRTFRVIAVDEPERDEFSGGYFPTNVKVEMI